VQISTVGVAGQGTGVDVGPLQLLLGLPEAGGLAAMAVDITHPPPATASMVDPAPAGADAISRGGGGGLGPWQGQVWLPPKSSP